MNRRIMILAGVALLLAAAMFYLMQAGFLYLTPTAVARHEVTRLLAHTGQRLPPAAADLTDEDAYRPVAGWEIEDVALRPGVSFWATLRDDDPTYHLTVDLRVRFQDGDVRMLAWEGWRYGWVLGPITLGRPDGPLGRLRVASGPGS